MLKKLLVFAITSGLAASAWKALELRLRRQRLVRQQRTDGAQIRRWEDEGGATAPTSDPH